MAILLTNTNIGNGHLLERPLPDDNHIQNLLYIKVYIGDIELPDCQAVQLVAYLSDIYIASHYRNRNRD